jgi:hypothetical protein
MIRSDRFLISQKPFAIDLSTVAGEQHQRGDRDTFNFSGTANALWFRRKDGVTRACIGTLMLFSHFLPAPLDLDDPHAILSANLDGRYGGKTHGRWDGDGYWGAETTDTVAEHLAILRPMLANYPDLPPGHDGWYRF